MCGITGSVTRNPATQQVLDRQLDSLRHRGPDAAGGICTGGVAIGQNRLAIIDLVAGDPPLTDESGAITSVLNGEIYNFRELRDELLAAGHRFHSACDTEVIAHLAESLDAAEIAARLDGMFAFAVWDASRDRLILGRDRLGKKPFYYWWDGTTFVFGSEIKAILAHPAVPRRLDLRGLPTYLALGYVPTPDTFFQGIKSLPPGHVAVFDRERASLDIARYWEPPLVRRQDQLDIGMVEAADEVHRLLVRAVGRRLIADVPLGAFLSGGLDSSSVVAAMCEAAPGSVRTFTVGFDDDFGFDERPHARTVARHLGTDHTELLVHPDIPELLDALVWHHDQPFGDSSALPTYLLAGETRKHVTVALCGDGGDELFAGYERFAAALAVERLDRLGPVAAGIGRTAASFDSRLLGAPARVRAVQRLLGKVGQGPDGALRGWTSYVPDRWAARLLDRRPDGLRAEVSTSYACAWQKGSGLSSLDRLLHVNLTTYLLDDLLPKVDRMSMAHGLEVRSPLLDVDLLEFSARLPPHIKAKGLDLKRVLKNAMAKQLPEEILKRPKHGFGAPLDRWFRTDLAPYVRSMLSSREAKVREVLSAEAVDAMVAAHMRSKENLGSALWTLLTLESFLRQLGD